MYRRTTNPQKFLVGLIMSCVPGAPKKTRAVKVLIRLTESSIVICLSSLVVSEELRTCGSERVYSAGAERERLNCQLELN